MGKIIKIELEMDNGDYIEFLEGGLVQGDLSNFLFAELCQNLGMGFLTSVIVEESEEP